jgi:predicted dehydrogenase
MPSGRAGKGGGVLRVAVVGVGHLGRFHARAYREMEGVSLVAVADADAARAEAVAAETHTRGVTDYRDVPDEVEAVSVAVPTASHREVAEHFLARGVACLVEKPMAPSAREAEALLAASRDAGALLQVGHIERFNPAVRAARPYIERPRFIECSRVAPFSFRSKDIGVVFDLMIHDLDIVAWLVGEPLARVDAVGASVLIRGREDIANARLVFEGGCIADLTASRIAVKAERTLRLFQEASYVSIDTAAPSARVMRPTRDLLEGRIDVASIAPGDLTDPRGFLFHKLIEVEQPPLPKEQPLQAELRAFVDSVREGAPPAVTAEEGLEAIRLAERILEQIHPGAR